MLRHLRMIVFFAIVAAVAIGLLLPNPLRNTETAQVTQIPQMSIN